MFPQKGYAFASCHKMLSIFLLLACLANTGYVLAAPSSGLETSSLSTSTSSVVGGRVMSGGAYSYYYSGNQGNFENLNGYNNFGEAGDYLSDWNAQEWAKLSGRMHQPKCVTIPSNMSLCRDVGYTDMMMPNLLGHDTLREVTQQATHWVHLVNINCHPDLKVFLCSLFSPVCLKDFKIIFPCRTLCSSVKASCEGRMMAYGFEWPEMLNCTQYPEENDMCIKLVNDVQVDNNCSACRHPLTYEALIDHFCHADVVMKVTLKDLRVTFGDQELVMRKKKKFFKIKNGISKKEAKALPMLLVGGASCQCNTLNITQGKFLVMGNRQGNQLVLTFAMPWDKKNKEFKKGVRAIRKQDVCEGIFKKLSDNGGNLDHVRGGGKVKGSSRSGRKQGKGRRRDKDGKRKRRGKGKDKRKRDKKKRRKGKGRKGRKGRKERRERKERKERRGRKGSRRESRNGSRRRSESSSSYSPYSPASIQGGAGMSRAEIEDRALSNFRRASN